MITWLVTWVVISIWMIPCPQSAPAHDEYGRRFDNAQILSVACWDSESIKKQKIFDTLIEAKVFVDAGEIR